MNANREYADRILTHAEAAQALSRALKGKATWSAAHYNEITQRYPEGVPESALAELEAEWATPETQTTPNNITTLQPKKTGGDAC